MTNSTQDDAIDLQTVLDLAFARLKDALDGPVRLEEAEGLARIVGALADAEQGRRT